MSEYSAPPAYTGTWGESVETRLAFVESVIRAGHAVGKQPGTAPTTGHIADKRSAAEYAAGAPAELPTPLATTTTFPVKP